MSFACSHCTGNVSKGQAKGNYFTYGPYNQVKLTKDLEIHFCEKCHEVYPVGMDFSFYDAMEASLPDNVKEILDAIKERHGIKRKEVASFCDLTPETLSRYQGNSDRIPAQTYNIIQMIANEGRSYMDRSKTLNLSEWKKKKEIDGTLSAATEKSAVRGKYWYSEAEILKNYQNHHDGLCVVLRIQEENLRGYSYFPKQTEANPFLRSLSGTPAISPDHTYWGGDVQFGSFIIATESKPKSHLSLHGFRPAEDSDEIHPLLGYESRSNR